MSILLLLFLFTATISHSSSIQIQPARLLNTRPKPPHSDPQEYIELTHPLPFDRLTPSCTVQLLHHSFAHTINKPPFTTPYTPPSTSFCAPPWSGVGLHFFVHSQGDQYDRVAALWLGGVELLRTTTAEPTESGIFWSVRKDVTRYSSLFVQSNLSVTMMLENIVNKVYTGIYHVNVSLSFYKENIRVPFDSLRVPSIVNLGFNSDKLYDPPADLVVPVSSDGNKGFWYQIEKESDMLFKKIRFPRNVYRAILELYVSYHGDDEFWYSNPPNSYIQLNNLTTGRGNGCYREVFVTIDGKFVGSEVPFPVIFTGGINPLFWEPVVAIGAFSLPSYDIDLTPFLASVLDGKQHEIGIGVDDGISYWLVDANLHIWLDHKSAKVHAQSVAYVNPAVNIKRRENFKLLDGVFETKARRQGRFGGWVKSSLGNLTTVVLRQFRFGNTIKFNNNGEYKSVQQNVKIRSQVVVSNQMGVVVSRVATKRVYPLNLITSTLPASRIDMLDSKKDKYLLITNVSHAFKEKSIIGTVRSKITNTQVSNGWMKVKDHSVLSGEADTIQSYSIRDGYGCYTRAVEAKKGKLLSDNTTFLCQFAL